MSEEARTVAQRLDALPEAERQQIAGRFNSYLNKLDDLKAAIAEGIDSGDDGELDVEAIIREARAERDAASARH